MERRHLLCGLERSLLKYKKMKPSLFDCIFLVIYASASVIANEASVANTTEGSTQEKSSNKADKNMLVCIL